MNDPFKTEEEWLLRIKKGDKEAFSLFFYKYYNSLCYFAINILEDSHVAEDVVQDVFVTIWNRRKKLSVEGSIRSYLYKSVKNRSINYLRSKKLETKSLEEAILPEQDSEKIPSEIMQEKEIYDELVMAIEQAIEQLPKRQKLIFTLSRDEGLTYEEIAEVLDISVKTVKTQIGRSKVKMREVLSKYVSF